MQLQCVVVHNTCPRGSVGVFVKKAAQWQERVCATTASRRYALLPECRHKAVRYRFPACSQHDELLQFRTNIGATTTRLCNAVFRVAMDSRVEASRGPATVGAKCQTHRGFTGVKKTWLKSTSNSRIDHTSLSFDCRYPSCVHNKAALIGSLRATMSRVTVASC